MCAPLRSSERKDASRPLKRSGFAMRRILPSMFANLEQCVQCCDT